MSRLDLFAEQNQIYSSFQSFFEISETLYFVDRSNCQSFYETLEDRRINGAGN